MNTTTEENDTLLQIKDDSDIVSIADECLEIHHLKTPFIWFMFICIVPALFGNSLIIISYVKFRYFHGMAMYKYVVNMAVSDLLLGFAMLLYPVGDMLPEVNRYKYFCITRFVLVLLSIGSSVLFLTLISVDRFLAIVTPLSHRVKSQNKRKIWSIICVTWTLNILVGSTAYLDNDLDGYDVYDPAMPCYSTAVMTRGLSMGTSIAMLSILLLDFVLYCFVLRAIMERNALHNYRGSVVAKTKLMIIVYVTFVVCWLPLIITDFVFHEQKGTSDKTIQCLRNLLFLLGVIQACTNWLYYGILNSHFRKAFRSLLCCCRKRGNGVVVGNGSRQQ